MFAVWVKSEATVQCQPQSFAGQYDKPALQKRNGSCSSGEHLAACSLTWGSGERFQGFACDFRGRF
jgi:hypothetical protein